jgi:hypothetical protein
MQNPYSGLVGSRVVMVTIERDDIVACNIEPALASLNKLIESPDALKESNGTISLLVGGYDHDPRELHTIPEVRGYFQALDAKFPYWFHVCTRIDHSLRMQFMMLADLKPVTMAGAVSFQFANDDLHAFLLQRLQAMDSLHARHDFSEDESLRITELVMNYFESVTADDMQRIRRESFI